jgi:hypothetical protein
MPNDKITKPKTTDEILKIFESLDTGYNKSYILKEANKELEKQHHSEKFTVMPGSSYYKAMTMLEFNHGVLLSNSVPDLHSSFAIEFFQNLLKEFECKTPSEKSLAEVVTLNFIRILETQRKIKDNQASVKTRYDIQYIAILSKELDRAERHYMTSLEALRTLHSPSFNVSIKTNTAVIGQNQAVQIKNANDC